MSFFNFIGHLFLTLVSYYKKHGRLVYFVAIIVIFICSLITRFSFYLDTNNVGQFMFFGLGGDGDYDWLFKFSMLLTQRHDFIMYFWSFSNDYPVLIRLCAFLFHNFGILVGIQYLTFILIIISSLCCLLPFILLSKPNKPSIGGFIGSTFLITNPLINFLASGRAVDTVTGFFFSIFVIFYILALRKRNYLIASLAGIAAFMDSFNRGLMTLNDIPALVFFSFFIIYISYSFIKKFPYIKIKKSDIFYSITPFFGYMIFYTIWNIYYSFTFHMPTMFSPQDFLTTWNPAHDKNHVLGNSPMLMLASYSLRFFTAMSIFPYSLNISMLALILIIIFLTIYYAKKNKFCIAFLLLPMIYVGVNSLVFWLLHTSVASHTSDYETFNSSFRYFFNIPTINFFMLFVVFELFVAGIIFLKKEYIMYFQLIVMYFFILGYGYFISFSERHFLQVILIFFILFGLMIDKIFEAQKLKRKTIVFISFIIYLVWILITPITTIINSTGKLVNGYINYQKQKEYLSYAKKFIPKDGIILSGMIGDNVVWDSMFAQRSIAYNINSPSPIFIPYGKNYFHIPMYTDYFPMYIVDNRSKAGDFNVRGALEDLDKFKKNKFYILDYDIRQWKNFLNNENSGHLFLRPNMYTLKQLNSDSGKRPVYQLVEK